nr:hypothetical protein [Tanacetum cinerariifolium]
TTVTKPATNPRDVDANPMVNIQDFCEEYYEDILPIIMDMVRRDKRKEVHASETYLPSTTKSRPGKTNSRDHPRGRSHPRRLDASNEGCPEDRECFCVVGESYDNSYSHSYHDRDRSRHMKRRRDKESPLSSLSKSDSGDGRYQKSKSKRHKPTDEDDLTWPCMCEEEDPFTPRICYFEKIHNIKQKDRETIEDFMKRFKVEPERMKRAHECMRIFGFMHGVNILELTKCLNEHVPKTMEEMMITTTGFIRGEAAAASKKKGKGSSRFTPLTRTPKEILAAEAAGAEGPLVIEAEIGRHMIHRMYVDGGSSMEILYEHSFNRLWPEVKNQMVPTTTSLTGFNGETIWPLGQLWLLVTIGDADHSTRSWINFMIVRSLWTYNDIIGRHEIKEIQAVPSTAHGMLKFPVDGGIVTICSTVLIPAECAMMITSSAVPKEVGARLENFKVALHPDFPDQEVAIRETLSTKGRTKLCTLMMENLDIFAWQPSDMTGVPWSVAQHRLNIREGYSHVWKKKSGQALEVQKLVEVGIIREVYYHDWLSNPVMIQLAESDKEKTAFHTSQGEYCYTKMPFGLKNAGATYQRLVDKAFHNQISQSIKVYVDELVFKSHAEAEMLRDVGETFRTLRKINMKLNPKNHLYYCYRPYGQSKRSRTSNGKLDSLNRFLSKSAEKSLPLFKTLKKCIKKSDFHWTSEAEQAVKQLKQHFSELPLLVAPKPKKELIVYLFASYGAISAVLMTERGAVQTLVYFVSRILQGPKLNYTPMKKLVMLLVFSAKRHQSVMLGEHNITYQPRTSVKGHVLADFLAEVPDESSPAASVFAASSNEAEYEALIAGLRITAQMGVQNVHISVDSKLIANQVLGTYVAKEENMIKYLEKVKVLVSGLTNFSIRQIPRSKNKKADALNKIASTSFAHLSKLVLVEILKEKSIKEKEVTTVVEEDGPMWMTPIMEYLKEGTLPSDRKEARKLRIKARQEIHEGSCNMHAGPQSVVAKAIRLGYCWPTMYRDARDMILTWNDCKVKFLIVDVDCFTKWIEAKAVATITGSQVKKFVWDNIVCRFGLPEEIVSDNEIGMPTYSTATVDVVYNDKELRLNLDLLEERREPAAIREATTKLKMTKYYNARVRGVTFRPGDFVYRSNNDIHALDGGKLGPKWEGPYEVTEALGDEAYKLRSMNGIVLLRTWNIANLKRCYI